MVEGIGRGWRQRAVAAAAAEGGSGGGEVPVERTMVCFCL